MAPTKAVAEGASYFRNLLPSPIRHLLFDWSWYPLLCALLLAGEAVLGVLLLTVVPSESRDLQAAARRAPPSSPPRHPPRRPVH